MSVHPAQAASVTPGAARWCLRLLDSPSLIRSDASATKRLSPKDAALLALIALDGPLESGHAAALIWPDATEKKGDASLRQRLFRLRRETGASLVETGALLKLAPDLETDLDATLARLAEDEHAAAGDLLPGLSFDAQADLSDWLIEARRRWRTRRDAVLTEAAQACEASGAVARGLVYALRLIESDPLSDHAQRRVMRLHHLRGDSAAAIAAFEHFERRLKDELGSRPSAETVELLRMVEQGARALPPRRAVVPASLMRPPRLVGRDGESAALERAWIGARAFLLLGEAGIGKSRLLGDFVHRQDGAVSVQARPGDAGIAYALIARVLRAVIDARDVPLAAPRRQQLALVLPELGHALALAGEAQRLMLLRAVDASLADAQDRGLRALVVDDLHFADDASIEFLQSLTQSDALGALRWGFAQRPAEGRIALRELRAALEDGRHLESVTLGPLDAAQIQELLESLSLAELDAAQLAPALLRHSGGNPLFALETLKDMLLTGVRSADGRLPQPSTVAALVERRLAQLSAPALKLARVAALAQASFNAELAATVLELHPLDIAEPWRELEAAQVIRDGAFAHDLIFEATRASVPAPIARLLHRRIALVLSERETRPEHIAPHWAGAHEWARAGEAYAQAARLAQAASQRGHEVDHWQQAQRCFDAAGDADRSFDVRCDSMQALIVVHGVAHADAVIETLLAQAGSPAQRAAALTARAMAALMAGDHPAGIAAAVEAGALAHAIGSEPRRFEAARLHAVGLAQAGRAVEGLAVIEALRAWIDAEGNAEQQGRFWADYAYVLNSARRLRDTAAALGRAIDNAQTLGDLAELATLTSNLATVQGNLGHVDQALELARRALALQVQLGTTDGPTGGVVETYVGLYAGMTGRYTEALERLDSAIARFERDHQTLWLAVANNHRAAFLIELGQFARADQALSAGPAPVDTVRARSAALSARIERALGTSGEASLRTALDILTRGGDPHVRMHALLDEASVLDPGAAVQRCAEVARLAGELEFAGVVMRAELQRALALHHGGRTDAAATLLRSLLPRLMQVQPADMYLPDAWWIALQVFSNLGADDEAAAALASGVHWIRQVALPQVPEPFRDSFLHRNPTNRALLNRAAAGAGHEPGGSGRQ
jgi:DNA-binding SARP family transcriptional activator